MKVLVTGAAGFIGAHLARHLTLAGHDVVGVDRLSDYYSRDLKRNRVTNLLPQGFDFRNLNLRNFGEVLTLVRDVDPETVFHLAAQPGIRLPIEQYESYIGDNISAFQNILTSVVETRIPNFIYASSSSVYGNSSEKFLSEDWINLSPISYYGKTKLLNELTAGRLIGGSATRARGLRFFTVYGPFGRPDMAYFRLISNALEAAPFTLYGNGSTLRDFTYIDDVIEAIEKLANELSTHSGGFEDVVNVGGGNPISVNKMIEEISQITGKTLDVIRSEKNINDVDYTCAATDRQLRLINWKPTKNLDYGLNETIKWMSSAVVRPELIKWISG